MDTRAHPTAGAHPFGRWDFWAAAILGAALSLAVTGYAFPVVNNVYHLPIVARLWDLPDFAGDPFVQSLRHFSSGLWMMLAGSAEWVEPRIAFFGLLALSRLLSLVGFLACADRLGLSEPRQRFLFAALIAVTPLMQSLSFAGRGGLFIDNFTHTEVANGLFLLALWAALAGRFATALALIGVTFFVNAFYGVWLGFVLAGVIGHEVLVGRLPLRRAGRAIAIGFVVSVVFALPVVVDIVANPDFGRPLDFDFVDFLLYRYPNHVLFGALRWHQPLGLALVVGVAVLALRRLGDPDRRVTAALLACLLLYAIGIVVPSLTHAPLVLNLHLLRSGVMIHMIAALLSTTLAVRWWFGPDRPRRIVAAVLMAVLALPAGGPMRHVVAVALIVVLLGESRLSLASGRAGIEAWALRHGDRLRAGAVVLAVLCVALSVGISRFGHARTEAWLDEWAEIARWARTTPPGTLFLTPTDGATDPLSPGAEAAFGAEQNAAFETLAHRSLWVDPKRGAVILWYPSYHGTWRRRMEETTALLSLPAKLDYARAHGIAHVVAVTDGDCPGQVAFRTKRICVTGLR